MHIVNVMFSKGLGGIEQSMVDYCEALKMSGHKVTAIIAPQAQIKTALLPLGVNIIEVKNFAAWDIFARAYLKKIMGQLAPDAVIAHGNRAISLAGSKNPARTSKQPCIIGVTHNYSIRRLIGLDAILATTEDLKAKVIAAGQPASRVYKLPNMVRVERDKMAGGESAFHSPLVIGTMGRFVKKKGFAVFIQAIAQLNKNGVDFKAIIGGGGEEEEKLKQLATELGLTDNAQLTFSGWVQDKRQFFEQIDIFCLPSLHEPFGIILLEAFAYRKPVITTDAEGPGEIATHEVDAVIVPKGDAGAMARAIARLAANPQLAGQLAQNGFAKAENYDIKHFAAALSEAVLQISQNKQRG